MSIEDLHFDIQVGYSVIYCPLNYTFQCLTIVLFGHRARFELERWVSPKKQQSFFKAAKEYKFAAEGD